jgi:hypothetical protein
MSWPSFLKLLVTIIDISDFAGREYGSKVVGEVTLDQVYGGARGIKSLVWEVSGNGYAQVERRKC